jgi:low temperature requirement protein LtrA
VSNFRPQARRGLIWQHRRMVPARRARMELADEQAAVTPIELFFDLVFVFALTQVTALMAGETTGTNVIRGALVVGVLWWCWVGYAWLGNVVRADEGAVRLAMFGAMAALLSPR